MMLKTTMRLRKNIGGVLRLIVCNEIISFSTHSQHQRCGNIFLWPLGLPKLSSMLSKPSVPGRCTLQFFPEEPVDHVLLYYIGHRTICSCVPRSSVYTEVS